ncbi:tumor necrosis factor receptor superfamily member 14 isoform X2 [Artibeus jamaicensis]|uniref:tumor necrosis factor receptor superfamily member 14 isoform X2 n=1 Tax=Artibeus jamaicensis TaxID=9417 RepID=UPI00235ABE65|nr:tumor necrosis factor receptor superfamily member 14 isoform X2 [Artibeus jamaicensis]
MEPLQAWEPPRWSLEPTVDALSLTLVLVFLGCPPCARAMTSCKLDEYPVGDYCCPKCRPGYRVKEACRGSRTTLCAACTEGTFTAHLNGLNECLQCRVCDPDMGLVIRQKCSSTANTLCGCARGHFCVSDADQCAECRPHSVCKPGQRVQEAGTEHRDTVCEDCPPGTFSPNGTLAACLPWTQSVPLSVALASTVLHLHPVISVAVSLSCGVSAPRGCPVLPPTPPPRLPAAAGPSWAWGV